MPVGNITSANAIYMLGVINLFPVAQKLESFSTDSSFDTEAAEMAEVQKGVDGKMVAGFIPYMSSQSIMLQPSSSSIALFDTVIQASKAAKTTYEFFGLVKVPALMTTYTLRGGILTRGPVMPPARKVLQPRTFTLMWDDITPSPMVAGS